MLTMRKMVTFAVVLGCVFLALPAKRRAAAQKLAGARRFVSRRIADLANRAERVSSERWDGEGGAIPRADSQLR
jgi:outer membrane murein-binding lipoprotein Lpp